jgi:hypothetical protein
MVGQLVERKNGAWTYTPLKYWPTAGQKISFFGITYGPGEDNGVKLVTSNGETYKGYPSFRVTPHTDLSKQKDIGVAYAMNRTSTSDGGKVPLSFKHAMHKVNFAARYTTGTYVDGTSWMGDGGYLKVSKIDFGNVYGSGTLNITPEGNDVFSWTDVAGSAPATYSMEASAGRLVTTNLLLEGTAADAAYTISTTAGTLMLVPQENAAPDITLTATIYTGCTNRATIPFVRQATLQSTTWEAGKSTTYNFTLDISDDISCWGFAYTGKARTFVVPRDGTYKLEVWGASGSTRYTSGYGSNAGLGGYSCGSVSLKAGDVLYIYVGGDPKVYPTESTPTTRLPGGYNGGGDVTWENQSNRGQAGGGGGGWYGGGGKDIGTDAGRQGGGGGGSGWVYTADTYSVWLAGNATDANKYEVPDKYYLTDTETIAGNVADGMPNHADPSGIMTGNRGHGHARITLLSKAP